MVSVLRKQVFILSFVFLACGFQAHAMLLESDEQQLPFCSRVIIIAGTSCSGKSTLAKALQKRIEGATIVKKDYPEEQIRRALGENVHLRMQGWRVDHICLFDEIKSYVLKKEKRMLICEIAPVNKNGFDITASFVEELQKRGCLTFSILVYCPLGLLFERNHGIVHGAADQGGAFYEPASLLTQFLMMYTVAGEDENEIGTVFPAHINSFLDTMNQKQKTQVKPAIDSLLGRIPEGAGDFALVPIVPIYPYFRLVLNNDIFKDCNKIADGKINFDKTVDIFALRINVWLQSQRFSAAGKYEVL